MATDDFRWSSADVLRATGGSLAIPDGPARYQGVSTDTRRVLPGEIFIALRGPHHDGHGYLGEAARHGAAALVVERASMPANGWEQTDGRVSVIEVDDTLRALGDLAAYDRRRRGFRVAAVTGSNGKTTTKEMIAAIMVRALGGKRVLHTTGTENNLIGVPLTLLRACGRESVAIVELGMNAPGEIWRLAEIADPDVAVVTCVAPAHIEGLGDVAGVARAKGEIYRRLRSDATAVVNADDPRVCEIAQSFAGKAVRFGTGADVAAEAVETRGLAGVQFTLVAGAERRRVDLSLPGAHNVTNALAAAAVARVLGATLDDIAAGLARLPRLPMRLEVVTLPGPVTIINDAYNANPASMVSALSLLARTGEGARIAVLGEMRELGSASVALHREVGRAAAAEGVSLLITVGPSAGAMRSGALDGGMDPGSAIEVGSHSEAAAMLRERVRAGDHVLIKGSRAARMENVVEQLREACRSGGETSR